jgi:hypothetical protein
LRLLALLTLAAVWLIVPGAATAQTGQTAGQPATASPTVRLWATREGLIGRITASGHVIVPNDHFIALSSRKALNQTVVVSYHGKSVSAPVLDIGPWNRDEAWWETGAARGQFQDLPRFVPEVWAAYANGYNGGRDAIGRYVTFPAMIDLSDGVYNELGLKASDWVDATLTWIQAPSPPPLTPTDLKIVKRADPSAPAQKPTQPPPAVAHDERYFAETGYRIDDDGILAYFNARGRVAVFGFPVSRTFTLLGCRVQIFQRQVAQNCAGRDVGLMNFLDPEVFPYDHVNGSQLPTPDPALKAETPAVGSAGYATAIVDFVHANAPDTFNSFAVAFGQTFFGNTNPLIALEVWGAPISVPRQDPSNTNFVYQRFQRGVMHYDATTGKTQALLLADYLKNILRGRDLPDDLAAAAKGSKYFGQYCPSVDRWVCRPGDLAGTDLTFAFEPG